MFVDDDATLRSHAGILLEKFGYRVTLFADATDVSLPTMNGVELALAVGAVRPGLPFLLLSGDLDARGRRGGGLRQVMSKSLAMEALRATVAPLPRGDEVLTAEPANHP